MLHILLPLEKVFPPPLCLYLDDHIEVLSTVSQLFWTMTNILSLDRCLHLVHSSPTLYLYPFEEISHREENLFWWICSASCQIWDTCRVGKPHEFWHPSVPLVELLALIHLADQWEKPQHISFYIVSCLSNGRYHLFKGAIFIVLQMKMPVKFWFWFSHRWLVLFHGMLKIAPEQSTKYLVLFWKHCYFNHCYWAWF